MTISGREDFPRALHAAKAGARPHGGRLSDILRAVAADQTRERVSVADLFEVMRDRAFGALMLIFAAPNVLPTPPGFSTLLAAPLIFLATQLALSRPAPWLPKFIASRSMPRADFAVIIGKVSPWLERAEKLLKPRLSFLTRPPFEQAIGVVCLILAIILFLPIPHSATCRRRSRYVFFRWQFSREMELLRSLGRLLHWHRPQSSGRCSIPLLRARFSLSAMPWLFEPQGGPGQVLEK